MSEPVRRCAGCGRKTGKSELFRVVRLPRGELVFDPELKEQGRSLYFCPTKECFDMLMRRKAPEKLLKSTIPQELRKIIECYLTHTESAK